MANGPMVEVRGRAVYDIITILFTFQLFQEQPEKPIFFQPRILKKVHGKNSPLNLPIMTILYFLMMTVAYL
jgi:hypothetical protein